MSSANLTSLQTTLEHETGLVHEFLDILQDEIQALEQGRPTETLSIITQRKNACADQLAQAAAQREQLQQALSPDLAVTDLQHLSRQFPLLTPQINQLFHLGHQASELNQHIGQLIQQQLRQNQETLNFLSSLAAGTSLYDAYGRNRHSANSYKTTIKAG